MEPPSPLLLHPLVGLLSSRAPAEPWPCLGASGQRRPVRPAFGRLTDRESDKRGRRQSGRGWARAGRRASGLAAWPVKGGATRRVAFATTWRSPRAPERVSSPRLWQSYPRSRRTRQIPTATGSVPNHIDFIFKPSVSAVHGADPTRRLAQSSLRSETNGDYRRNMHRHKFSLCLGMRFACGPRPMMTCGRCLQCQRSVRGDLLAGRLVLRVSCDAVAVQCLQWQCSQALTA